jgi:hypothetical protein
MKAIQIILATTATAGTIAIGGAAFAMAGGSQEATPSAATAALPPAQAPKVSAPEVPADAAHCLQASKGVAAQLPGKVRSKVDAEKLKAELDAQKLKSKLPEGSPAALPGKASAGAAEVAKGVDPKNVTDAAAKASERVRAGLPDCLPKGAPEAASQSLPAGAPNLHGPAPQAPELSCDSVAPLVQIGGAVERKITTPSGLKFVTTKARTINVGGDKVCAKSQEWNGKGGEWLKVEQLKGLKGKIDPAKLRQALRLPQAQPVTLGKDSYWQAPVAGGQGGGMMWSTVHGTVVSLTGSPALQYRLQEIATQLHQVG